MQLPKSFDTYVVRNPNSSMYGATAAEWEEAGIRNYEWHADGNDTTCREFADRWITAHIADECEGMVAFFLNNPA